MMKLAGVLAGILLSFSLVATPTIAQEKKSAAVKKGTIKPVTDNDKMKAWEVTYKPGQGSEMQARSGRLVHAISGGTMRRTGEDGKTSDVVWKKGDTRWLAQEKFSNTNVGKTTVHLLVMQPK
jgi:hypothetical protein